MVKLLPMTEAEFEAYSEPSIREYAAEHVRVGNLDPAVALEQARKEFLHYLPEGVATKDQYVLTAEDSESGCKVGMIWFAVRQGPPQNAFIYDIRVYPEYQRRGYGTQILSALDEKIRSLGIDRIGLHVFGGNEAAIAMYKKANYEIADMQMVKRL